MLITYRSAYLSVISHLLSYVGINACAKENRIAEIVHLSHVAAARMRVPTRTSRKLWELVASHTALRPVS